MRGPIGWYDADTGLRHGFCRRCGTTLFSERVSMNAIGLTLGSLDETDRFAPTEHIWTSAKQAWLKLDDDLLHYPEAPPG